MASHGSMVTLERASSPETRSSSLYRSRRFYFALLLLMGTYCRYSMRSHLGVAMVCMVNATAVRQLATGISDSELNLRNETFNFPKKCHNKNNPIVTSEVAKTLYQGSFVWTTGQQAQLFSASFYGNCLVMLASGYLADRHGARLMALVGMTGMLLATVLSPFGAQLGFWPFWSLRILLGVFENPVVPAIAAAAAHWFPAHERGSVSALYSSGNQLALSFGAFFGTKLCSMNWLAGWPLIFYVAAALGTVWTALWVLVGTNTPSESRLLTQTEKDYLFEQQGRHFMTFTQRKKLGMKLPLGAMLSSPATIAVLVCQLTNNLSNTLMIIYLPSFARDVLELDLSENGIFTALPFFLQLCSKNLISNLTDSLKRRDLISPTTACRICQSLASFGGSILQAMLALTADCSRVPLAYMCASLYGVCFGGISAGSCVSSLLIAPSFTGTIASLALVISAVGHVVGPTAIGQMVQTGTREEWQLAFLCIAASNFVGGVVFALCGSAEEQEWAKCASNNPPTQSSTEVSDKCA